VRGEAGIGQDEDPVERVRALVDRTLAGLLPGLLRPAGAPAEVTGDIEVANAFATLLTPSLLAGFRDRATVMGGPLERAEQAVTTALEYIRDGRIDDARGELVIARGALVAAGGPVPTPAPVADPCDLCERADPVWQLPIRGGLVVPTVSGALSHLLACRGCLDTVRATTDDAGLADALGYDVLPRSLRGLHTRLAGEPQPRNP
jgi:hypothetical protein